MAAELIPMKEECKNARALDVCVHSKMRVHVNPELPIMVSLKLAALLPWSYLNQFKERKMV